ncbi:hypothetical protein N8878_02385 [Psychromonas sp.]|nr:hypothetical protein [Psychromonas sp.]
MIEYNQRVTILNNVSINFVAYYQKLKAKIELIHQKQKTRKELEGLPEHLYQDISLTKNQVEQELKKFFWK